MIDILRKADAWFWSDAGARVVTYSAFAVTAILLGIAITYSLLIHR